MTGSIHESVDDVINLESPKMVVLKGQNSARM
jgi:hypothetical protein